MIVLDGLTLMFSSVLSVLYVIFEYALLTPKKPAQFIFLLCVPLYLCDMWVSGNLPQSLTILRGLVLPTMTGIIGVFAFYKDRAFKKFFALGMRLLLTLLCELISATIWTAALGDHMAFYQLSYGSRISFYFLYFFLYLMGIWGCTLVAKRVQLALNGHQVVYFFLFPFSQFFLFVLMMWFMNGSSEGLLLVCLGLGVSVCIAADIALFFAVRNVADKARLEAENRQLAQTVQLQYEHYEALADQYQRIRKLRHDIANHAVTIRYLIDTGKAPQAQEYAAELSQTFPYST